MTAKRLSHALGRWLGRSRRGAGSCATGQDIRMKQGDGVDTGGQEVRVKTNQEPKQQRGELLVCSFCSKQQDQVQRLIAGPGNVFVCDECAVALSHGPEAPQEKRGLRCSFCGKQQKHVPYLAAGPHGVNICHACLVLCREIMVE